MGASPAKGVQELERPVTAIATGLWTSCALLEDHSVWCWGDDHSQSTDGYEQWARQIPLAGVSKLVGANKRMFAVTMSGELFYWGAEIVRNQAGGGATPRRLLLSDVTDVAASSDDVCALQRSGRITCVYDQGGPVVVATLPSAKSLALSHRETCALLGSGQVTCFGNQQAAAGAPVQVTDAVELAAASNTQCALRRDGGVSCWPHSAEARSFIESVGHEVRHLSGTPHALCALKSSGLPRCLAQASGDSSDRAVLAADRAFPNATELSDVRFGADHACALVKGVAWCWGENTFGQLGQPRASFRAGFLTRVSLGDTAALRQVTRVATAKNHRCIVVSDGTLRCWGDGEWGMLGTSDFTARAGPTRVPGLSQVTDITVNETTTCALLRDGSLHCFGRMPWREELPRCTWSLSDDDNPYQAPCTATPSLTAVDVAQMGLGDDHLCALGKDGRVRCWGNNDRGQLGTGDTKNRATPTPVLSSAGRELGKVSKLRVFAKHACAVLASGAIECWGDNAPASQGRPYNSEPIVTRATPLSGVAAVTDVSEQCLLLGSGELRCWGNVFPNQPHDVSYEPVRIGRCRVSELSRGRAPCFADASATSCFAEDGFSAPIALRHLSGSPSELCGIDDSGALSCWNMELPEVRPLIGTAIAADRSWPVLPEPGCARDPAPNTWPKFPPVPPASVTAHDLHRGAPSADNGVRLSKAQVSNLLNLLNDPKNYTNRVTCHESRQQYVFRDAGGRAQATLGVSDDCFTIDSEPEIPAQRRGGGGNIVSAALSRGLAELCRSLHLGGCPTDE
ncbi:MAG TPA: hypothetical protein VFK05_05585 [Polyangiaceae bacterium]|nr:hypothetical protein [Polyangiaceae bacterium]